MTSRHSTSLRGWLASALTILLVASGISIASAPAAAATGDVTGATLSWGVKESFRNYLEGPIAHGGWDLSSGVTQADDGQFNWSSGNGNADVASSTGTVNYGGAIHFTGHASGDIFMLDVTLSNVRVKQASATEAMIIVDAVANTMAAPTEFETLENVNLAKVVLPAPDTSTAGVVTYADAATTLTAEGTAAFSGFYGEGEALDPVSFSWPVEAAPIPDPKLTVSKTAGLNPDGETITVSGTNIKTGFVNRHGPGEAGVYAQIGYLDSNWRPSQGAESEARSNTYSKWVKETAMGAGYLAWSSNGDGTADFSWDVEIDYDTLQQVRRPGATLAVFTLGAGGTVQAMNELAVPISFEVPTISVSKTTNLDSAGETITVTGTGFVADDPATTATRPPLAPPMTTPATFGGAYVAFGKFADVWKPSDGAGLGDRTAADTVWVVHAEDLPALEGRGKSAAVSAEGNFEVTLTVKRGFTDKPGNYGVYTYPGSGATYERFETYTPISFTPLATDLTFTASPSGQAVEGAPVTLKAELASPTPGSVTFSAGGKTLGTATVGAEGVATLVVKTLAVGTHPVTAKFTPADPESFVGSTASLSYTVVAKPVTNPTAAGSLTWGVKQAFRDYITGPIAAGSISTTNARSTGSAFVFGQAAGGTFNGSTGTSNYAGTVRFLGHGGVLDLTLSNPVVQVNSASSGTLLVRVNGATVPFATLALGSGSKSTSGGAVSYSRVPATLTGQGASAFVNGESQFYPAGTALDPVSFVIGAPSSTGSGTRTVSQFLTPTNTVPPTPPATTGITLDSGDPSSVNEGDEVTIAADGFEPNETGIKVVIYSDPVVLATDVAADSAGVVTWTGALPGGLTGEHTLTLQGSVDRGLVLTIVDGIMMTTSMNGCVVTDATITWGFKEAFRSYISGAIAHGEWTVADGASYETPSFGWTDGEGSYDAESGEAHLVFEGSVTFTGHDGVLNTTIANPQLRFDDADTATLLLDVSGDTRDGVAVDQPAVEFATIDLGAAETETDAGKHTITAAPAVLTAAGSAAFGTYEPATDLDPITIAFTTDADCAAPVAAAPDDGEAAAEEPAAGPGWLLWVIIAVALAVLAAIVWFLLARRRSEV